MAIYMRGRGGLVDVDSSTAAQLSGVAWEWRPGEAGAGGSTRHHKNWDNDVRSLVTVSWSQFPHTSHTY